MIAMLVFGFVITIGFAFYEVLWARRPVVTKRFWRNMAVVAACTIGFFDFVSCFYISLASCSRYDIPPSSLPSPITVVPSLANKVVMCSSPTPSPIPTFTPSSS